jgi:integrase
MPRYRGGQDQGKKRRFEMALLVECPACRNRNSVRADRCKCGMALKKLGHKNYWIEYYDDAHGRKRERIGPSKAAAEQRLREVLKARTEGRHISRDSAARISLKELTDWYKKLPDVTAKRSFVRDEKSIKNLLRILNESSKIKEITPGRIDAYRQRRLQEKSSRNPDATIMPSTVNREVACLKTMLSKAVRHRLVDTNSLAGDRMLAENNVRMASLDETDFQKLLDFCPVHVRPVVIVGYYLGMRKSEVIELTWKEVDLKTGFIRLGGSRTKNKCARSIPIHPKVKEVLETLPRGLHTERVFLFQGKPLQEFKNAYRSACKQAGLEDFTYHDLRHCAINNLRLAGNDYFKIMAMSGHKTMNVFKRYNLVTEEELHDMKWEAKRGAIDTNMDTKAEGQ